MINPDENHTASNVVGATIIDTTFIGGLIATTPDGQLWTIEPGNHDGSDADNTRPLHTDCIALGHYRPETPIWTVTVGDLQELAGHKLADDIIDRVAKAIDNSSIPQALEEILTACKRKD